MLWWFTTNQTFSTIQVRWIHPLQVHSIWTPTIRYGQSNQSDSWWCHQGLYQTMNIWVFLRNIGNINSFMTQSWAMRDWMTLALQLGFTFIHIKKNVFSLFQLLMNEYMRHIAQSCLSSWIAELYWTNSLDANFVTFTWMRTQLWIEWLITLI